MRYEQGTAVAGPARAVAASTEDEGLFEIERPAAVGLHEKFFWPPFSVLDRRIGEWQDRRRRWLALGMQSELGRTMLTEEMSNQGAWSTINDGVSIFDPVLCELVYRWYTAPGDLVLDPFAGGSVRGVVASVLEREYLGVELRGEQVAANRAQTHLGLPACPPTWLEGDSTTLPSLLPAAATCDLVFTCPPYADLEVYSDDPRDISTMRYPAFLEAQQAIIMAATARLEPDRFACWVTSDVRDGSGPYRGLVGATVQAFEAAGLGLYNDIVVLDPVGTAAIRAGRYFKGTRKVVRMHQHLLVFLKGDARRATRRIAPPEAEEATA